MYASISRTCPACGVFATRLYESRNVCPRCGAIDVTDVAPLASESAIEHVRNAQQIALHLESLCVRDAFLDDASADEVRATIAALKRRLGWVAAKVDTVLDVDTVRDLNGDDR